MPEDIPEFKHNSKSEWLSHKAWDEPYIFHEKHLEPDHFLTMGNAINKSLSKMAIDHPDINFKDEDLDLKIQLDTLKKIFVKYHPETKNFVEPSQPTKETGVPEPYRETPKRPVPERVHVEMPRERRERAIRVVGEVKTDRAEDDGTSSIKRDSG